jgi:hypothetical protein
MTAARDSVAYTGRQAPRHYTAGARRAAAQGRGGMTPAARPWRRRPRATAARQALRLCEAEQLRLAWDSAGTALGGGGQSRTRAVTARAALRAVGVPPHTAAALRGRLRLAPEQEPKS